LPIAKFLTLAIANCQISHIADCQLPIGRNSIEFVHCQLPIAEFKNPSVTLVCALESYGASDSGESTPIGNWQSAIGNEFNRQSAML
jgi:hypothetical protein